jgi:hypothetical protein
MTDDFTMEILPPRRLFFRDGHWYETVDTRTEEDHRRELERIKRESVKKPWGKDA